MATEETLARATIELGVDATKLSPEMAAAVARAQSILDGANKKTEQAAARSARAIQSVMDRINAVRPTKDMERLEQAVAKLGGTARLTADQAARAAVEVNRLAAAGAKVPASLQGLTSMGSKLGAAFQSLTTGGGISGALATLGPAGVAAAAGLGAVTLAGGAAVREIADLASQAEQWSNIAKSTGLGITEVQQLSAMLEDAGIPAEALKKGMKALSDEIATGGKQLEPFGISIEGWDLMSQEERLQAIAKIISEIEDPATASAVAVAAFGKSGADLIPVMDQVASGAYKMYGALGDGAIASLAQADQTIDAFMRKLTNAKRTLLAGAIEIAQGLQFANGIPVWSPNADAIAESAASGAKKPTSDSERARQLAAMQKGIDAWLEDVKSGNEKLRAENAKRAESELAAEVERNALISSIIKKSMDSYLEEQAAAEGAAQAVREHSAALTDKQKADIAAAQALEKGAALKSVFGKTELDKVIDPSKGLWTRFQDVVDQEMENAAAKTGKVAEETASWSEQLGNLSQQLASLASTTGGLAGKVLSLASSLANGLGGILNGLQTFKKSGSGLAGILGKISGVAGIAGAAVGVVGGIIGGLKKLFGGKSKEQKAAEEAAKKQKADEARQAQIQAAQDKQQGLLSAKSSAESLMERIAKGGLSEGLTAALQKIIGKVSDALVKSGLGILDQRLKDSEQYQNAQGAAGDVAGAISGMSQADMVDAGLTAAGGEAARALKDEAVAAATAAGLPAAEAQKAGLLAVANILREQLNASIRSGKELDANTAALLEEAKANGIEILADPALQQLDVSKQQLAVLQQIAGQPAGGGKREDAVPAAGGFGPMVTPDLGGGLGPLIQTHPGELAMVIPRSRMGRDGFMSAASGIYAPRSGRSGRAGGGVSVAVNVSADPFQTAEGRRDMERRIMRIAQRETSRHLAAQIASGRA